MKRGCLGMAALLLIPTLLIGLVILNVNYPDIFKNNDPKNIAGSATKKWGDVMKRNLGECRLSKSTTSWAVENWYGTLTRFEHDKSIKLPANAKFVLYDYRRQKFVMPDRPIKGMDIYSVNNPDETSIIVVYMTETTITSVDSSRDSDGTIWYYYVYTPCVKMELIDTRTWKVFDSFEKTCRDKNQFTSTNSPSSPRPEPLPFPTAEAFERINWGLSNASR